MHTNPYQEKKHYRHPWKFPQVSSQSILTFIYHSQKQVLFLIHYFSELHFKQSLGLWCEVSILEK